MLEIQANVDKCKFRIQKTKFIGLIISIKDIQIDLLKVSTIFNLAQPTFLHYVRLFFRFCNFYRRFIQDFFKLAKPLTGLTKKDIPFN